MFAWLKRVWKWIVGVAAGAAYLICCWFLYSSLFGASEETKKSIDGVNGSIARLDGNVKKGTDATEKTKESVDTLSNTLQEKVKNGFNDSELNRNVGRLLASLTPAPTGPGAPGGTPVAFSPVAAASELLIDLGDSDKDVAADAAAQIVILGRQGDAETLEGLALAYYSGNSRTKTNTKWCLDRIGEPVKVWQASTLANPGTAPRLRVAIERLTSYEASNEAHIARLQAQQNQAKKKLTEAEKVWSAGRDEYQKILADHSKKLEWLNTKVKALERARAQSQPRPQSKSAPAPAPAPAATSAISPAAANYGSADPPVRVVNYGSTMPYTYYRAPAVRSSRLRCN